MGRGVKKNTPGQAESRAEPNESFEKNDTVHVGARARTGSHSRIGRLSNFVRSPVPFSPELLDNCESRWRNYVVLTTLAVRFSEDGVAECRVPIRWCCGAVCWHKARIHFHFRASAARDIFLVCRAGENMRDTVTHVIVSSCRKHVATHRHRSRVESSSHRAGRE